MTITTFARATKKQAKLRLALEGPAGYGKSYSALAIARGLVDEGQRIAAVDTEGRSLSLYASEFDFDVIEMDPPFHPRRFVEAIKNAEAAGYGAIILDSLSHAWSGEGGTLDIVDDLAKSKYRGDSHAAWREGTAVQQTLVDAILRSKIHVLAAMRTKSDYVREEVERDGRTRTIIRKAGTKTIQRDEFDFEFTIIGRFDVPAVMTIIKSRCASIPPETLIKKPGDAFAKQLRAWLDDGAVEVLPREAEAQPVPAPIRGGNSVSADELRTRAAAEIAKPLDDGSGRMPDDVRAAIDRNRMSAPPATVEQAKVLLKSWGYHNWAAFFASGTGLQAAVIAEILAGEKVPA